MKHENRLHDSKAAAAVLHRTTTTEEYLEEKSVRRQYALSVPWLRKRRCLGLPPKYYRVGRMIRYKRTDIEEFLQNCAVEPANGDLREPTQESAVRGRWADQIDASGLSEAQ